MVALRWPQEPDDALEGPLPKAEPADWLTLQQAACELNVSISTARRMIRKGRLRNRIVPRPGGFAYRVYLPNSRHARVIDDHACVEQHPEPTPIANGRTSSDEIRRLERQVEHLSEALSRALRTKQKALPPGMGDAAANPSDPYGRYRWLARRRRWWPF